MSVAVTVSDMCSTVLSFAQTLHCDYHILPGSCQAEVQCGHRLSEQSSLLADRLEKMHSSEQTRCPMNLKMIELSLEL